MWPYSAAFRRRSASAGQEGSYHCPEEGIVTCLLRNQVGDSLPGSCLDIFDGVGQIHLKGDGLAGEGLDEDLYAAAEPQDEVEGRLLLDVLNREGAAVLQLLPGDQPVLVRRDPILILKEAWLPLC